MKGWEALTGAEALRLRQELKIGRDELLPRCGFPNARSAARISNIEKKESWKEGDQERLAKGLASFYVERGLPVPPILTDAEWTGPVPEVPERPAPQPKARRCTHPNGFTRLPPPPDDSAEAPDVWVCPDCGEESPDAARARAIRQAADTPVGGQVEVAGVTFTKIGDDPFGVGANPFTAPPNGVVDVDATDDEDDWDAVLASWVDVDTSEVRQPDYQVTNSELRTWMRCPRKWWLEYFRKLGSRVLNYTSSRATGDRVHRALKMAYTSDRAQRVDARDALERVIVEDWTEITNLVTDPTELAVVSERFAAANALERAMIEGYVEWLAENGSDADYETVGSEQVLSALFDLEVDGKTYLVELLGKLDARLRRKSDGALLFMDHKTLGNFVDVVPGLRQNQQMLTYVLLEALNASDDEYVSGALYNMLRRVKRTARANPPFYDRLEVHHNHHEIDAHRAHVHGVTTSILRARAALEAGESHHLIAYPNPTGDCRFDCPFTSVCPMFDDGSPGLEDMLSTVYVHVDPRARYDGIVPERATVDTRENVK
jgi:hypothetical protein